MMRLPITDTKIRPKKIKDILGIFRPKKKPKPKEHNPLSPWKSAWLVTINTNQNNPGLIEPLHMVWQYILEHITTYVYGRGYVTNVSETHRVIEMSKSHRIHMHTKIEISTNGIAYLDFPKITEFINKQMRQIPSFKGIYFNATLIKNYNQATLIKEYTEKEPYTTKIKSYPGFSIQE